MPTFLPHKLKERWQILEDAWQAHKAYPTCKTRDKARLIARALILDPVSSIRSDAVEALGYVGNSDDRFALLTALRDEDALVRTEAVEAIACVMGRRARKAVLAATNDPSPLVRRYAWIMLGQILGPEAEPILREASRNDPDDETGVGIWSALACLGALGAIDSLHTYATGGNKHVDNFAQDILNDKTLAHRIPQSAGQKV